MLTFRTIKSVVLQYKSHLIVTIPILSIVSCAAKTLYDANKYPSEYPSEVVQSDRSKNRQNIDNLLNSLYENRYQYVYTEIYSDNIYDNTIMFNSYFKLRKLYHEQMEDQRWCHNLKEVDRRKQVVAHYSQISRDLLMAHLLARCHFYTYFKHFYRYHIWPILWQFLRPFIPSLPKKIKYI